MIRVGDVYKDDTKMCHNCTITFISRDTVNVLGKNGGMFTFLNTPQEEADFLRHRTRIAEYKTWLEAVNSKEFNDE